MNWQKHEERLTKHQLRHKAGARVLPQHRLRACSVCYPIIKLLLDDKLIQFNAFNSFYSNLIPEAQYYTAATIDRILEAFEENATLPKRLKDSEAKNLVRICGHIVFNYTYKSRPIYKTGKLARNLTKTLHRTKNLT